MGGGAGACARELDSVGDGGEVLDSGEAGAVRGPGQPRGRRRRPRRVEGRRLLPPRLLGRGLVAGDGHGRRRFEGPRRRVVEGERLAPAPSAVAGPQAVAVVLLAHADEGRRRRHVAQQLVEERRRLEVRPRGRGLGQTPRLRRRLRRRGARRQLVGLELGLEQAPHPGRVRVAAVREVRLLARRRRVDARGRGPREERGPRRRRAHGPGDLGVLLLGRRRRLGRRREAPARRRVADGLEERRRLVRSRGGGARAASISMCVTSGRRRRRRRGRGHGVVEALRGLRRRHLEVLAELLDVPDGAQRPPREPARRRLEERAPVDERARAVRLHGRRQEVGDARRVQGRRDAHAGQHGRRQRRRRRPQGHVEPRRQLQRREARRRLRGVFSVAQTSISRRALRKCPAPGVAGVSGSTTSEPFDGRGDHASE